MRRLDEMPIASGTAFDRMPYGEKLNEVEKISKSIASDPAKAAMQYGATAPQDIVGVQTKLGVDPRDARVLTNYQAEELGGKLNAAKNGEEVLQAAQELQKTYGVYAENATADLVAKGNLKPEMNAAMSLAVKGRPEYRRHIDLLTQAANAKGDDDINLLFKARGFDDKSLNVSIPSSYNDMEQAVLNEGNPNAVTYMESQRKILAKLAKMSMVYDGLSYDNAVKFAMKPIEDDYSVANINGAMMRVPSQYDSSLVEDVVDDFISDKLPKLIDPEASKDYVYSQDKVIPILNATKDGVQFIATGVGAIAGKDKKPINITFKELLADKKPSANIRMSPIGPML